MRWKWQILKLSSIWLFTVGVTAFVIVCIGLGDDLHLLGPEDWTILGGIAGWTLLLSFVHYMFVRSSRELLQQASEMISIRWPALLAALLLNLLVLAGWIFAGIIIAQEFRNAEANAVMPPLAKFFAYQMLLSLAFAVGNYLLAINAYFECQYLQRKHEEDILHAIGNPYLPKHP